MREGKKTLIWALYVDHKLGIYNTSTKVWIVLLSALLVRNLHSFVQTLQAKNNLTNEIDIKCIMWGVTNSRMIVVVSLSFDVGETNCSQGSHAVLSISFKVDVPTGKVGGSLLFERQRCKLSRGVWGHAPPENFEI